MKRRTPEKNPRKNQRRKKGKGPLTERERERDSELDLSLTRLHRTLFLYRYKPTFEYHPGAVGGSQRADF